MVCLNDFLSSEDLNVLFQPIESAVGLPGRAYGAEFYSLEQRDLFPRSWCAIGVGAQVPDPGDMLPVDLAGRPLLVSRTKNGSIKVFHNVCRHRCTKLVSEPCKSSGKIHCPWHGWTYDLDGRLVTTPNIGGPKVGTSKGIRREDLSLVEVRSAHWLDYIFVNLDGRAPAFEDHISPVESYLHDYDMTNLRHGGMWQGSYPGNWKVSIEGAMEDYHLPFGHPELMVGVNGQSVEISTHANCFAATRNTLDIDVDDVEAPSIKGQMPGLPRRAGNGESGGSFIDIINIFPTAIMVVKPDHVVMTVFSPDGPDKTFLGFHHYFCGEEAMTSDLETARRELVDGLVFVASQDLKFIHGVQANNVLRDELGIGPRFSPYWEGAVHHFQKMVVEATGAELRAR